MFATKSLIALTAIASLAAASSANAEEFQSNGRTSIVRYQDINLADAEGQKQLQRRISAAANRVCATMDLAMMRACKERALENVAAPVASAIARASTGEHYADAKDAQVAIRN